MKRAIAAGQPVVAGWREWASLPGLGVDRIKVKIDTGARTSALHAFDVERFDVGEAAWVRFVIHPLQRHRRPAIACTARLVDERLVTSSNGTQEHRYVITTLLRLGRSEWPIEVTLTNRDEMTFRMLLGRQAIRRHVLVDPSRSFHLDTKTKTRRFHEITGEDQ